MPRKPKAPPVPTGILLSQIGYDTGLPMRAIVRGDKKTLPKWAGFAIIDGEDGMVVVPGTANYWGECWGSHWWVADFSGLEPGTYGIGILSGRNAEFAPELFFVGDNLLWEETAYYASVDQAERRQKLAREKCGWYDAGTAWQEANSHTALILGFCDMLEFVPGRVADYRDRLEAQILNGCDYLARLQDKAAELPNGKGAVVHQIWKYDELILPADVAKAVVAWTRAARFLSDTHAEKKREYLDRAEKAFGWLHKFKPENVGGKGFSRINHGLPDDAPIPDEWMTRDLLMQLWGVMELGWRRGGYNGGIKHFADQIIARQIKKEESQSEFYGHFRTFASADYIEKAWIHHGDGGYGYDCGGTFPHWVLPLLYAAQNYPKHPDAPQWEQCVRDFAYGYLLPACRTNPFNLLPLGEVPGEGVISFAGLWHGMNAAYALTAAQAFEFAKHFNDSAFLEIATGNLQWIAGLNSGLTQDSLFASHMYSGRPGRSCPACQYDLRYRRANGRKLDADTRLDLQRIQRGRSVPVRCPLGTPERRALCLHR